ncbi:MAG: crossover junction endodeoxyribonuclease RuvC, partial [Candidatus Pacebacteria bacterium]|nr:crossover junction endodeoxyribonuclease RuvC [Candidatus Paceibacterota bacterium]
YKPQVMAVEELFYFKNKKTVITVAQARGVILFVGKNQGLEICEYTPLQVKQAVVGYGRAEKKQVQQMVKSILDLKEIPKPDDAADALAVAVCCESSYKFEKKISKK